MTFDPERWLQVANICCIKIPDVSEEALLRTALNRAYYAALLSLKKRIEAVQGRGAVPPTRTHEAIYQAVRTGGGAFKEIYETLRDLRSSREAADYELHTEPPLRSEVYNAVKRSRWLIRNRINAFRDDEFRRLRVPPP